MTQINIQGLVEYFFRWYLLHCLTDDMIQQYDRFVVTRSDFYHLFKHVPLSKP